MKNKKPNSIEFDSNDYMFFKHISKKSLVAINKSEEHYLNKQRELYGSYSDVPNNTKIDCILIKFNEIENNFKILSEEYFTFDINKLETIYIQINKDLYNLLISNI